MKSGDLIKKFSDKLKQLASKSENSCKHAALLLDKKYSVICSGYNRRALHAEEDVIFKWRRAYLPRKRIPYMVLVVRISGKRGRLGFNMSRPCIRCQKLITLYGLKVTHS